MNKFGSAYHVAGTRAQKSGCNVAGSFELASSAREINAGRALDIQTMPAGQSNLDSADQASQSERKIRGSHLARLIRDEQNNTGPGTEKRHSASTAIFFRVSRKPGHRT
jgi:hypothetical protein